MMDDNADNKTSQLTEKQVNAVTLAVVLIVLAIIALTGVILLSKQ